MKPRTFTFKPIKNKIGVFADGRLHVKLATLALAADWATRQEAEDRINRLRRIAAYLGERAVRSPVVAEPSNQIGLF